MELRVAQSKAKKSGSGKGSARPGSPVKTAAKKPGKPNAQAAAKRAPRPAPPSGPKVKAPAVAATSAPTKKPPAKPVKPAAKPKAPPASKPATTTKPQPTKPAQTKPAQTKPAQTKPAQTKPAQTKPAQTKPAPAKDAAVKAPVVASKAAAAPATEAGKPKPKGITVVAPKPVKKVKPKKVIEMPRLGGPLLGPGGKKWKPLIPSGPNAVPVTQLTRVGDGQEIKSHLPKKELDRYKDLLTRKRVLLAGDVQNMENQALTAGSGALSAVPQHIAEQGSDTYDQSLSLDLAQVDRNLIKEIDDALVRIEKGTFGICEVTGKPISKERLDELPWTRYSIEAARERERRSYRA
ncbi:MAG: hypothetical protein C0475_00785 [Planctomyces sp.]|nr:hypothetical protein [Planctomyces sp.]